MASYEKTPYVLGLIPEGFPDEKRWEVEITDHEGVARVIPDVGMLTLTNKRMQVSTTYGLHPSGNYALYTANEPGGGGAIAVPHTTIDQGLHVGLVYQKRDAAGGVIPELPRGFNEPNESHLRTAQRELGEETGLNAVLSRFFELGREKNYNTAFHNTSGIGDGLRFYGLEVFGDELEFVEDQDNGDKYHRFNQDLLDQAQRRAEARAKAKEPAENIMTSRFYPLERAMEISPDLMTSGGVGLLFGHLQRAGRLAVSDSLRA